MTATALDVDRADRLTEHLRRGWLIGPLHSMIDGRCTCREGADCGSPAKHPRTPNGLYAGTHDLEQVRKWLARWPDCNWFARTGSQFDVVDLDGDEGIAVWNELCDDYGYEHNGPQQLTGRGLHLLFAPSDLGNDTHLAPHVDYRGQGGYIVIDPSTHGSGKSYLLTEPDVPLPELPGWVKAMHRESRASTPAPAVSIRDRLARQIAQDEAANGAAGYGLAALEAECDIVRSTPEGERNDQLNASSWKIGRLVSGEELDEDTARQALLGAGEAAGQRGRLGQGTVASGLGSGMKMPRCRYGPGRLSDYRAVEAAPRPNAPEWEDPVPLESTYECPPFPTDALPSWQRQFVEAVAESTQTPPELAAMAALCVIAACARNRVEMEGGRPDWFERSLCLYWATAMESGALKSPTLAAMTEPLEELERELRADARTRIIEAKVRRTIAEQAAGFAEKEAAKTSGPVVDRMEAEQRAIDAAQVVEQIVVPVEPQILCDDTTPERLVEMLGEQGGALATFSAEGGIVGQFAGRYESARKPGGVGNFDVWLKAYTGETIRVHRKGSGDALVERPALTMCLAIQPEILRNLAQVPGAMERGFIPRFLFSMPANLIGRRNMTPNAVPEVVRAEYRNRVTALGHALYGQGTVVCLRLSPEAAKSLVAFRATIEPRIGEGGDLHPLQAWAAKLHGQVSRLAGVIHLSEHGDSGLGLPIAAETVERAAQIGRYLLAHAQSAFDYMGADVKMDRARWLRNWLAEQWSEPTVTRRDIQIAARSRFPKAEDVQEALELLTSNGWLRHHDSPVTGGRKVAGGVFELHPRLKGSVSSVSSVQGKRP